MQSKTELVTELTGMWYGCLIDHHKDRDCHWEIHKRWSYGEPPKYVVVHYGYVGDEITEECDSNTEAEQFLVSKLLKMIEEESKYYLSADGVADYGPLGPEVQARLEHNLRRCGEIRARLQGTYQEEP